MNEGGGRAFPNSEGLRETPSHKKIVYAMCKETRSDRTGGEFWFPADATGCQDGLTGKEAERSGEKDPSCSSWNDGSESLSETQAWVQVAPAHPMPQKLHPKYY